MINIENIDQQKYILSFEQNCFIKSSENDVLTIDGVVFNSPLFVKKNTPILIQLFEENQNISIDNYLDTGNKLFDNMFKYNYPTSSYVYNKFANVSGDFLKDLAKER